MSLDYIIEGFFQRSLLLFFLAPLHCCWRTVEIITIFSSCKNCLNVDCTSFIKGELYAIRVWGLLNQSWPVPQGLLWNHPTFQKSRLSFWETCPWRGLYVSWRFPRTVWEKWVEWRVMGIMIWNSRKTTRRKKGEALGRRIGERTVLRKAGVIDRKGLPWWN